MGDSFVHVVLPTKAKISGFSTSEPIQAMSVMWEKAVDNCRWSNVISCPWSIRVSQKSQQQQNDLGTLFIYQGSSFAVMVFYETNSRYH